MQATTRWGRLGILSLAVAVPLAGQAAGAKSAGQLQQENLRLQEENRQLADEVAALKAQLADSQPAKPGPETSAAEVRERGERELNAPLLLTPEEQAGAPGVAATSSTPPSSSSKDFAIAVGLKIWLTEWNTWRTPNFAASGSGISATRGQNINTLTSTSDSEVSPVPSFTARYKDFFLSGSYLATTDYQFSEQSQVYDLRNTNTGLIVPATLNYKLTGSREEWDVTLGYQVLPYLAATVGYKSIEQNFYQQGCVATAPGLGTVLCLPGQLNERVTYAGPTLGLSGSAPIGHGFGLYGSFAYGWLGANYNSNVSDSQVGSVDYYVGELGVTYSHLMKDFPVYLPLTSATAYAGYRYQSYESELSNNTANGNNPKDVVQGFVTGVNFAY
jgi:hypothetical protein